jgi:hypothetical protein
MRLFDSDGRLKQGKQKLVFFFNSQGDGNCIAEQNCTPGNISFKKIFKNIYLKP